MEVMRKCIQNFSPEIFEGNLGNLCLG